VALLSSAEHSRTEFTQQLLLQARIILIRSVTASCYNILARVKMLIKLNQNIWVDQKSKEKKKKPVILSPIYFTHS